MGQRHQLFIVAKVGRRYRILAAVNNQWLYGISAVRHSLNVIEILRADAYQPGIRRELHQAQLRWPQDTNVVSHDGPKVCEFPFITTCLVLGASVAHADDFMHCQVQPLPINTRYDGITNDDGISVYDVTDAPQIRYGFTLMHDPDKYQPPAETIISARSYLKFYEDDAVHATAQAMFTLFDGLEMVTPPMMQSAWPGSRFRSKVAITAGGRSGLAGNLAGLSLKGKAMSDVIMNALHSDPADLSWVAHAEQLSGFATSVKDILTNEPQLVHLPSGVNMLARTLKDSEYIDLTPHSGIIADEIRQLLHLLSVDTNEPLDLILPDMEAMRPENLRSIVHSTSLNALHLGKTPLVKLGTVLKIIARTAIK